MIVADSVGLTTYRRSRSELVFTQEAFLITAHGKTLITASDVAANDCIFMLLSHIRHRRHIARRFSVHKHG